MKLCSKGAGIKVIDLGLELGIPRRQRGFEGIAHTLCVQSTSCCPQEGGIVWLVVEQIDLNSHSSLPLLPS